MLTRGLTIYSDPVPSPTPGWYVYESLLRYRAFPRTLTATGELVCGMHRFTNRAAISFAIASNTALLQMGEQEVEECLPEDGIRPLDLRYIPENAWRVRAVTFGYVAAMGASMWSISRLLKPTRTQYLYQMDAGGPRWGESPVALTRGTALIWLAALMTSDKHFADAVVRTRFSD